MRRCPGGVVAQWDKDDCEDLGIVKVDLLGLGMMSVMQDAFELCRERGRPLDLAHIPEGRRQDFRDDADGRHHRRFPNRKSRPNGDAAAHEAEMFLRCRHRSRDHPARAQSRATWCIPIWHGAPRKKPVTYFDERLKPVLERTLGVPLFQEQMLEDRDDHGEFFRRRSRGIAACS